MSKPTIKAIFVDFGNVCATFDFHRFIKNFSQSAEVPEEKVEEVVFKHPKARAMHKGYGRLFEAFECGEIDPVQFFHALSIALGCARRIDYATFARHWVDIFDRENADLDKLFFKLPQKKYLLSNTNTLVHRRHIANCAIIRNHFPSLTDRIMSYEVGVVKPNPLIYGVALGRANVRLGESLFLDDMPENIEAWRALGGVGIVYHAGNHSISELRKQLRALGVLE